MKGINAISTAIYINAPNWLCISDNDANDKNNKNESYIVLNRGTTKNEVDLFIFGLFCRNEIPFNDNSKESLEHLIERFNTDNIILSGGLMFYDGKTKILPSCCAGLEQWAEAVDDILNRKSPWLGHDPYPTIEYEDNSAIVWSDDYAGWSGDHLGIFDPPKPKSELQSIEFTNDELACSLAQLKIDIKEFITVPFCNRLKEIDSSISDFLTSAALKWLAIT